MKKEVCYVVDERGVGERIVGCLVGSNKV